MHFFHFFFFIVQYTQGKFDVLNGKKPPERLLRADQQIHIQTTLHSIYSWNKEINCDGDLFAGLRCLKNIEYILFLKFPFGFSILAPTLPPSILRIAGVTCVRNRDYLNSLFMVRLLIGKSTIDSPFMQYKTKNKVQIVNQNHYDGVLSNCFNTLLRQ